eukprot:CAMPEP_0117446754 /NCGR_PEP_ID=MMETSP0759-20121206/6511_1 /TAXON_ID=63605 /ORGANISM="Percolomonas cosmopolitus, Strain WS" /LENGTH=392 /DNA_ID=CAMNT_0005239045 /DNA_START=120 /DNA_END=1298 /DNA_ORIENTATION=+
MPQTHKKADPSAPIEPEARPQVYFSTIDDRSSAPVSDPLLHSPHTNTYQNASDGLVPQNTTQYPGGANQAMDYMQDDDDAPQCRLCLQGGGSDLIVPCKCSGSMKLVHRSCLDRWRAMSPRAESFSRCDQCLTNYQFISLAGSLHWSKYLKYGLLVSADVCLFLILWQVAVFLCTAVYWIFDSVVLDKWTIDSVREALDSNIPAGLQYYVLGLALFFFALGLVGLMVGFYALVRRCISGRSQPSYSSPHYADYNSISYHNNFLFSDWFIIWFLLSHPTGHYGGAGCGDCICLPLACVPGNCDSGSCPNGGGGGSGEGGAAVLGILAVILLVVVIVIIAVGVVFGTILTIMIMIGICRRHYTILRKKDECKRLIVKDLENPRNNEVSVSGSSV